MKAIVTIAFLSAFILYGLIEYAVVKRERDMYWEMYQEQTVIQYNLESDPDFDIRDLNK